MPQTPFKEIPWALHDPITKDKMDAMANNDIWLKENSPRAHYSKIPGTEEYETGLVLVSGRAYVPRRLYAEVGVATVYFGSAFLPGTLPQVTTGIVSDISSRFWVVVNGLPGSLQVDYRGFNIALCIADPSIAPSRNTYVQWHALGQAAVQA